MATFIQSTTGFNSSGSNQNLFTSAFTNPVQTGNTIIVGACIDAANAAINSITDTLGNSYSELCRYSAVSMTVIFYVARSIIGGAGNIVKISEPFLDGQIFAEEWQDMNQNVFDSFRTNTGTSAATVTSGSLNVRGTNELVFSLIMLQTQTNTFTAGGSSTNLLTTASNFTSSAMEHQTTTTAGNVTSSFGMTDTISSYIQLTACFRTSATIGGGLPDMQNTGQALVTPNTISSVGAIH